ncbi:uncharacterized protein LOC126830700 [Patella vulgata]|uniref:uncharacterized protein LOC126830700 n=1 Tax=Patella vulgata TaxID=6465 RepID=UPI0024A9101C|nr:uncharacterized protein LOC126830700 [Patella vulgata]
MQMLVCLVLVSMAVIMPIEGYTIEQLIALLSQLKDPAPAEPPAPQMPAEPVVPMPVDPVPPVPSELPAPASNEPEAISAITIFATEGNDIVTKLNRELSTLITQAMTQISLKPALDILEDIVPELESYFDELTENKQKLAEDLPSTGTPAASSNTLAARNNIPAPSESLATSILNSFSTLGAEKLTSLQAELANLRIQAMTQTGLAAAVDVLEDTVPEIEEFLTELTESMNKLKAALPSTESTGDSPTGETMDKSAATELLNKLTEKGQDFADTIQIEKTRITSEATAAQTEAELLDELAGETDNKAQENLLKNRAEALETKADQLSNAADTLDDILSDFEDLKENLLEWIPKYTAALPPPTTETDVEKRTLSSLLERLLSLPRQVQ